MTSKKFCLLATPRTGSHYVRALLGSFPGVAFYGELFNENGEYLRAHSLSIEDRDRDPLDFLAQVESLALKDSAVFGFKLMINQNELVLNHVLTSDDYQVILLSRRNKLAQYSSFAIARTSGVWFLHRGELNGPEVKVPLDRKAFAEFVAQDFRAYEAVLARLQAKARPFFRLDYDQMRNHERIRALMEFMEIEPRGSIADLVDRNRSVRQNTPKILDRFENPETVASVMRELGHEDWLTEAS